MSKAGADSVHRDSIKMQEALISQKKSQPSSQHKKNGPKKRKLSFYKFPGITVWTVPVLALVIWVGWGLLPNLIQMLISKTWVLSPEVNGELYSAFIHAPIPIYFNVYLFNVTNPEEVQQGLVPKLEQVGPYVFLQNKTKYDVLVEEESDTLTYLEYKGYQFQSHLSAELKLEDEVILINVPFVAAAMKIFHELPWPLKDIARAILVRYKEPMFVRKTVDEALFTGWKVPFLEKIEQELGLSLIPNNTFGFFADQNDTSVGPFTAYRGMKDVTKLGSIVKYKNKTELDFWGNEDTPCNKIQGTDGAVFAPFVTKSSVLRIFNPDLCRAVFVEFSGEIVYEEIAGYRFIAPDHLFTDPRESEVNKCFCETVEDEPDKCLGKGAMDLGPCREGAPVAMSQPYFLSGLPEFWEKSGLPQPSVDKHATFIDVEPDRNNAKSWKANSIESDFEAGERLVIPFQSERYAIPIDLVRRELGPVQVAKLKSGLYQIWLAQFLTQWTLVAMSFTISLLLIRKRLRNDRTRFPSGTSAAESSRDGHDALNLMDIQPCKSHAIA